jgi:hypothetical protein
MKRLLQILPMLILTACGSETNKQVDRKSFSPPFVYQETTNDTINLFKEDYISYFWAELISKRKFCDTLKLSIRPESDTTTFNSNDLLYECYYPALDSFGLDGLEVYPDYKTTVSRIDFDRRTGKFYYPVYIVNQTPNTKLFIGKDSHVFAIQEALDEEDYWRPIEGQRIIMCGNGYWGLKIHSDEFITVLFPKYEGDFKTKLRVRIQNRDIIYVSMPFDGVINRSQFILNKERNYHYEMLIEDKAFAIQHLFYGAEPLEMKKNYGQRAEWEEWEE